MERDLNQRLSALYNQMDSLRREEEAYDKRLRREEEVHGDFAAAATSTPAGQQQQFYVIQQERSETEELLRNFTQTMVGLLQRFVDVSKQPRTHAQAIEQFEGRVEEDPHRFTQLMQHYIEKLEYNTDIDRILFVHSWPRKGFHSN